MRPTQEDQIIGCISPTPVETARLAGTLHKESDGVLLDLDDLPVGAVFRIGGAEIVEVRANLGRGGYRVRREIGCLPAGTYLDGERVEIVYRKVTDGRND